MHLYGFNLLLLNAGTDTTLTSDEEGARSTRAANLARALVAPLALSVIMRAAICTSLLNAEASMRAMLVLGGLVCAADFLRTF